MDGYFAGGQNMPAVWFKMRIPFVQCQCLLISIYKTNFSQITTKWKNKIDFLWVSSLKKKKNADYEVRL